MPKFLQKTFSILENAQFQHCIRWSQDGSNIIITDINAFQKEVLPINFKHGRFSSFVRQLNMYDFHKVKNSNMQSIYHHKNFMKGKQQLLKLIKKKRSDIKNEADQRQSCQTIQYANILIQMKRKVDQLKKDEINNNESIIKIKQELALIGNKVFSTLNKINNLLELKRLQIQKQEQFDINNEFGQFEHFKAMIFR